MKEFFEALAKLKKPEPKKHFVTVEGKQFQVSLSKKLEMLRVGEANYLIKPSKFGPQFVLKPKINKRDYKILKKADAGYDFYDHDPYYPMDHVRGGWQWQHEQE